MIALPDDSSHELRCTKNVVTTERNSTDRRESGKRLMCDSRPAIRRRPTSEGTQYKLVASFGRILIRKLEQSEGLRDKTQVHRDSVAIKANPRTLKTKMFKDALYYESLSSGSEPKNIAVEEREESSSLKGVMGSRPPPETYKLVVVITFLVFAAFSNWAALAYIHDFVGREALPDVVFAIVSEQTWALKVGDAMVVLCITCLVALVVLHNERVVMLRRTFFIVACLYTMRTISLLCTQLPSGYVNNNSQCRARMNRSSMNWNLFAFRILQQTVKLGFQDVDDKMLCGDLLFSGHTISMVISTLTIGYYLPKSLKPLRYVPWILTWIGMVCMVVSRTHYTIDVVFAYWMSTGIFTLYHAFSEIETARERESSVLRRLWIMRVVEWLEENTTPSREYPREYVPLVNTRRGEGECESEFAVDISDSSYS
ncbi:Putative phosphatidylcholine:ceramide cholinephosphotransferase 3 [Toxocara canis]|uniref:Putative phosphatidylcholine:ceramide cholinephosphotransferase 3 n=1 Tax=Toxocara canis TaxID=6265 RepID=A0A0B2USL0_TOXCA|nr:Putative phosphatidylcholine:ceramide cholinephosphotransferase 3 [Toxocara canis]